VRGTAGVRSPDAKDAFSDCLRAKIAAYRSPGKEKKVKLQSI